MCQVGLKCAHSPTSTPLSHLIEREGQGGPNRALKELGQTEKIGCVLKWPRMPEMELPGQTGGLTWMNLGAKPLDVGRVPTERLAPNKALQSRWVI